MKHLGIIIQREYLNKIRNRSFVIMTFVSPLIFVLFAFIIGFLSDMNRKSKAKDIVIVDESEPVSKSVSISQVPVLIMGSMVRTIPSRKRKPRLARP